MSANGAADDALSVAVVTPDHEPPGPWLRKCHESVLARTHAATHILVADGNSRIDQLADGRRRDAGLGDDDARLEIPDNGGDRLARPGRPVDRIGAAVLANRAAFPGNPEVGPAQNRRLDAERR